MRYQGCSTPTGEVDEMESSAVVFIDRSNPAIYLDCSDLPSLTRQEFAADCDINTLMAQYEKTGVINHFNAGTPQYLDISNIPDLQESFNIVQEATIAFQNLPAVVRREFDNNPIAFATYAADPENIAKMREWGLAPPEPTIPAPQRVEIVNPSAIVPDDKSAA